jgi:hypothetical protein
MSCQTKIVAPVHFVPTMLTSTNAVNAEAVWTAGTYALGVKVIRQITVASGYLRGKPALRVFESLVAANTSTPGTDPAKWLDIGPANTVAMFSVKVAQRTTTPGNLSVEVTPGAPVTTVGFFGLKGSSIRLRVKDAGGVVTFDETRQLAADNVFSWFDYFFAPFEQLEQTYFDDVPCFYTDRLVIDVVGTPDAQVGYVVMGVAHEIGEAQMGATAGIDDYSTKEADEFGDVTFVERSFARRQELSLVIDKARVNAVFRVLNSLRATPSMLIASQDPDYAEPMINFGWIGSHGIVLAYPGQSIVDLEFKGLT